MQTPSLTPQQFLDLSKEEMHALVDYKPYSGGGGPNEAQVAECTNSLHRACVLAGFIAEITTYRFDGEWEAPAVKVGETHPVYVTYDRWGYCDEYGDLLDQASLYDAIIAIDIYFTRMSK